jgi:hypothetical protein
MDLLLQFCGRLRRGSLRMKEESGDQGASSYRRKKSWVRQPAILENGIGENRREGKAAHRQRS